MRKIITISLIFILCALSIISYAENETTNDTNEENNTAEINDLQNQRNEVQSQITESQEKIEEIEDDRTEGIKKIAQIDESIEKTETAVNDLKSKIEESEKQVQEVQILVDEKQQEYDKQQELLNKRLVAAYKAGETQYLDVLLNSNSLSDFLSNYFYVREVAEYDTRLLRDVEFAKNEIESKKQDLESKQKELETQKQEQLKIQKVLENNKFLRQTYIEELNKEEKKLQKKIDEYNSQVREIENEIRKLANTKSFGKDYIGGDMIWPIKDHYRITSPFGMRVHPITGVYKLHTGMDISAKTGDEFVAAAYGAVTKAEYNRAYGNMVIIDHGGGVQTLYAHGSSIEVKVGDIVNAGDIVLKVGSTGYSTGPHAHFEVRINGEPVNPLDYIPNENKN